MNNLAELEPRISSSTIYKQLGYKEHRALKQVISNNKDAFNQFSELRISANPSTGGRPTTSYYLTLDQVMMLATMTKTKSDVKASIIKSLMKAYKNSNIQALCRILSDIDLDDIDRERFVYVAREQHSGRYKIGISTNPERRIKELNTGNPENLTLVHAYLASDEGYKSEMIAHAMYEDSRIRSEWFESSIDLRTLPSYRGIHEDRTTEPFCDCEECSGYNDAIDAIDNDDLSREQAILRIKKMTKLSDKEILKHVSVMVELGVVL